MEMVHEEYKRVKQTDKPFPFEYWWRVVKDEPKWLNRDVAAVIRNKRNKVLAYGTCADMFDENLQIAESTLIETLENFCKGIIECFGPNYLRRPTAEDIHRLLHVGEARGFPGMLGSIDCMHWNNIPAVMDHPLSCLKLLPHMTYGYGMLFLVWLGRTMISMC